MEGYDLFGDDLPSLGGSMLDGLADLGGGSTVQTVHQGADQSSHQQYPPSSHQGQFHHQQVRGPPAGHSYHGSYPHSSGVNTHTGVTF